MENLGSEQNQKQNKKIKKEQEVNQSRTQNSDSIGSSISERVIPSQKKNLSQETREQSSDKTFSALENRAEVHQNKQTSKVPSDFESIPNSNLSSNRHVNLAEKPIIKEERLSRQTIESPPTWKAFFEEIRYEQNLLRKELKELSSSAAYVSKNMLKKFTCLSATKIRQRAEYYPDVFRNLADSLCSLEKNFLSDIKDPQQEEKENSTFGPK